MFPSKPRTYILNLPSILSFSSIPQRCPKNVMDPDKNITRFPPRLRLSVRNTPNAPNRCALSGSAASHQWRSPRSWPSRHRIPSRPKCRRPRIPQRSRYCHDHLEALWAKSHTIRKLWAKSQLSPIFTIRKNKNRPNVEIHSKKTVMQLFMAEFLQEIFYRFPHFRKSKPLRVIGEAPTCGVVKSPFHREIHRLFPSQFLDGYPLVIEDNHGKRQCLREISSQNI